ncbi:MAG: hypothetical protein LBD90_07505, partial [Bifidobacteriaceae bacterium]|nr:hypothetical protein [Bifidobacteriaceae bacterium]
AAAGALALAGALAGCAPEPTGFDSETYCRAIAVDGVELDAKALIDGDEQALKDAEAVYQRLMELAPGELADEWALVLRDLEAMISVASGAVAPSDVDRQPFIDAFTAIEMDKHDRCGR